GAEQGLPGGGRRVRGGHERHPAPAAGARRRRAPRPRRGRRGARRRARLPRRRPRPARRTRCPLPGAERRAVHPRGGHRGPGRGAHPVSRVLGALRSRWARGLFLVAALAFGVWAVSSQWSEVSAALAALSPASIGGVLLVSVV